MPWQQLGKWHVKQRRHEAITLTGGRVRRSRPAVLAEQGSFQQVNPGSFTRYRRLASASSWGKNDRKGYNAKLLGRCGDLSPRLRSDCRAFSRAIPEDEQKKADGAKASLFLPLSWEGSAQAKGERILVNMPAANWS